MVRAVNKIDMKSTTRWVVKIGSSLVTSTRTGLNYDAIRDWCGQISALIDQGKEIVIVSSGAIAAGIYRMGWRRSPRNLCEKQALAAVGQMSLVFAFEKEFRSLDRHVSQVLLTHGDLHNRGRYLNARNTLNMLIKLGIVPVVNENDTVATEEIRFGDNDALAAMVANLVEADVLLILTDEQGLRKMNPRLNPEAEIIGDIWVDDPLLDKVAGPSNTSIGRGGMVTKVKSARIAARANTSTVIASGREPEIIIRVASGEKIGTRMHPAATPVNARKQWLNSLVPTGVLLLDEGASQALTDSGRSLLAVGIRKVSGNFSRGDPVECQDEHGRTLATGLSNYSAENLQRIIGMNSERAREIIGTDFETEAIHRDNLALA